MTVTVTGNVDTPQQPLNFDNSYLPDQLIAGVFPRVTEGKGTIKSGATVNAQTILPRGTVLGQIALGAASSAAKSGGNTGNGTLVLDATTPILANALAGIYTVRCTVAGTNAATFLVIDPKGVSLGTASLSGSGGTLTFSDRIKFVITDGSTDFIVGDGFDVTIAAGTGKYIPSVVTAVDGSQNPVAILADQSDPSAGDVNAGLYLTGEFNSNAIVYDTGWTVTTLTPLLRPLSIFLKSSLSAADPS